MNVDLTDGAREVLSILSPVAAYLFGSAARGHARPESDVDIAILPVTPLSGVELLELRSALSEALGRDVDWIDLSRASAVLRKEVIAQGRLIKETDRRRREEFEMYALSDYARLNEERAPVLSALGQPLTRND